MVLKKNFFFFNFKLFIKSMSTINDLCNLRIPDVIEENVWFITIEWGIANAKWGVSGGAGICELLRRNEAGHGVHTAKRILSMLFSLWGMFRIFIDNNRCSVHKKSYKGSQLCPMIRFSLANDWQKDGTHWCWYDNVKWNTLSI